MKNKQDKSVFAWMLKMLPKSSNNGTNEYWTNGIWILVNTEEAANELANFLGEQGFQELTGYYDPEEDERNNEKDECTGYWYVDVE